MNPAKAAKVTSIVMSIFRLNGQMVESGNHFAGQHGLTAARWQMLGAIMLVPHPPSIPQISALIGMTRQGVLKQINQLVEDGLVRALPNPGHKRSPLYTLTEQGRAAYDALEERWQARARHLGDGFDEPDLDAALRVISGLSNFYDDEARNQFRSPV